MSLLSSSPPSLLQILPLLLLLTIKTHSIQNPMLTNCSGDTNYTIPSSFKTNLDLLLPNLTASALHAVGYFSTATSGEVYGLAQCRFDVSPFDCSSCLNSSLADIAVLCPLRRSAAVRLEFCILRYSDQPFFSKFESGANPLYHVSQNTSDTMVFNRQVTDLMDLISWEASASESRFGVGITNYSDFSNIYGMVQCTRDLSDSDCLMCLDIVVSGLKNGCYGYTGCFSVMVSCTARFDSYLFSPLSLVPQTPMMTMTALGNRSSGGVITTGRKNNTSNPVLIIHISVAATLVLLSAICICLWRSKAVKRKLHCGEKFRSAESQLFDLGTIRAATSNFSDANKLGEGGFGPVYKGALPDGNEIAVKRLSISSRQGLAELRNEVLLVAKLQHRNLVTLLGCCLQEQEKLLVYEFLPNASLDKFLFDPIKREQLNWGRRYKIIEGIGRGLLYLHEDSRLRIIHRDLKASNILLDGDMNPKISDFGFAKLFDIDETHGSTSRIAGTFGYMAPEYVTHGHFSTKSDVFSYGVLILEIVTGRRNSGFQESGHAIDLLNYVWHHWSEGAAIQLRDPSLEEGSQSQVLRSIHLGLLCVQEDQAKRPSMASVVHLLSNYSATLPTPSVPAFFVEYANENMRQSRQLSANDVSISETFPR